MTIETQLAWEALDKIMVEAGMDKKATPKEAQEWLQNVIKENDSLKQQLKNVLQMAANRIAQSPKYEDGWISVDEASNCIEEVAQATGNKCGDDSLWFSGGEWQRLMVIAKDTGLAKEASNKHIEVIQQNLDGLMIGGCSTCPVSDDYGACADTTRRKCSVIFIEWARKQAEK